VGQGDRVSGLDPELGGGACLYGKRFMKYGKTKNDFVIIAPNGIQVEKILQLSDSSVIEK